MVMSSETRNWRAVAEEEHALRVLAQDERDEARTELEQLREGLTKEKQT
jgi:hypothetical protein